MGAKTVAGVDGRKVRTAGRLLDEAGGVFAEATAIFVTLDPEKFGPLLEKVAAAVGRMPPPRPGSVSFHL